MANIPYTSQEIAELVNRWQICRFFDRKTERTIISLPNHELHRKGSDLRCDPAVLEQIKAALTQAYEQGVREVGMFCPQELKLELIDLALTVTKDPDWKIYPLFELTYLKELLATQEKLWQEELFSARLNLVLDKGEKELCDSLGFTTEVIEELLQYVDADFKDLPPHLQQLFAEGQEQPPTEEQKPEEESRTENLGDIENKT